MARNIKYKREGNILTIQVDLTVDLGPSKTGQSSIIASTDGMMPFDFDPLTRLVLGVYRKLPKL